MPQYGAEALAVVIFLAGAFALIRRFRNRVSPAELEKRRRLSIHQHGKLGDGEIIDLDGATIFYSYTVAGVGYTTSQDLSALEALLPADRTTLIGPVAIKFLTQNPANSIVLCEDWAGLRFRGLTPGKSA